MATLTIAANGQVTLLRELLRHLGVGPREQIEVRTLPGGRIEVCAAQPSGTIDGFIGKLSGNPLHLSPWTRSRGRRKPVGLVNHEHHCRYKRAGTCFGRG
jgi:hypothetical protein